jgi:hypothetical protein
LGEIKDESALDRLEEISHTSDGTIKINVIVALGKIGGQRSRDILHGIRKNESGIFLELIDDSLKRAEAR